MTQGYTGNIELVTEENNNFRQVLYTGKYAQLVVMSLKAGEDIGEEVHQGVDQFFRIEAGTAKIIIDGEESILTDGMAAIVPAGSVHNLINTGKSSLKLYTLYSPPNHPVDTIHTTRDIAIEAEAQEHK